MTFGAKLRSLREKHGLTQQALADAAGVRQNDISRWELNVVPAFDSVQALCKALGEPLSVFEGCDFKPAAVKKRRPKKS